MCVGNTYFKSTHMYKYTRVDQGRGEMEVENMITFGFVKKIMVKYVYDMKKVPQIIM